MGFNKMNKLVTGILIGLVIGLVLGVFIGLYIPSKTVALTNNQVTVSGIIQEQTPSDISFSSIYGSSQAVQTSGLITNGRYSVTLVGNESYSVDVSWTDNFGNTQTVYSLYVPSGVTTFTANF